MAGSDRSMRNAWARAHGAVLLIVGLVLLAGCAQVGQDPRPMSELESFVQHEEMLHRAAVAASATTDLPPGISAWGAAYGFSRTTGLAVAAGDVTAVSDGSLHRVQLIDSAGRRLAVWGGRGDADGEFDGPLGVAFDAEGRVLVADSGNHRVQVFAPDGTWLRSFGQLGDLDGEFNRPTAVAALPGGEIVVADGDRLQRFGADGTFIAGIEPPDVGGAWSVLGLAVDSLGRLHVFDRSSPPRVFRYAHLDDGAPEQVWSVLDASGSAITRPAALTIAPHDDVLISGDRRDPVYRFDASGTFLEEIEIDPAVMVRLGAGELAARADGTIVFYAGGDGELAILDASGSLVERWPIPVAGTPRFDRPLATFVRSDGSLLVRDGRDGVRVFTAALAEAPGFGGTDAGSEERIGGSTLDLATKDDLIVTDAQGLRRFDGAGALIQQSTFTEAGAPVVLWHNHMVVAGDGSVYLAAFNPGRVVHVDAGGHVVQTWGSDLGEQGALRSASGIALDHLGRVYVSDSVERVVQVYEPSGAFVRTVAFGALASGLPHVPEPGALTVDRRGRLHVADRMNGRVWSFAPEGDLLGWWGDSGRDLGQLQSASSITSAPDGRVFVNDHRNDRIYVWDPDLTYPPSLDLTPPVVAISCPDVLVPLSGEAFASWQVVEEGPGVVGATSGSVPLDTDNAGTSTAFAPVVESVNGVPSAAASCAYEVDLGTPTLSWVDPAPIVYGTPLGDAQLNAAADVAGAFTYAPSVGTVLAAGSWSLGVTFDPSDPNYRSVGASATLEVLRAPQNVSLAPLPNEVVVGAVLALAAGGGGSGQPVTFASATPDVCAVDGASLVTLAVGVCSVEVDQPADANHLPAHTVRASLAVRYGFGGFERPVEAPPAVNVVQAGRAVPLKWRLVDADGLAIDDLEGVRVRTSPVSCDWVDGGEEVDEYAAGGSGFQNLGEGAYQFNWGTPRSYRGTCRSLVLELGDGVAHPLLFRFR